MDFFNSIVMKRIYQHFVFTALSAILCVFMALPANAQRGGGGRGFSGGGGGRSYSGGGGRSYSGGGRSYSGGGRSYSSSGRSYSGTRSAPQRSSGTVAQRGVSGSSYAARSTSSSLGRTHGVGLSGSSLAVRGYGHSGYRGIGRRGGYFYSHGYYGSLYFPMLGLGFGYLPYGYYPFYWGGDPYYFSDGFYYQYNNDQYTVVEPPVGASINTLPSNAQSIVINGQQYYEENGVYYSPVTNPDGTVSYQISGKDGELNTNTSGATTVVTPKVGDMTTILPPDCRKININSKVYYVSGDGIYYQETTDSNNNKVYKIVGLEADGLSN
jgi:hypothetical protein